MTNSISAALFSKRRSISVGEEAKVEPCVLQGTPVQGSKLRLPGYLSGKGFQSGEEGTLISAAVLKARTQTFGGE